MAKVPPVKIPVEVDARAAKVIRDQAYQEGYNDGLKVIHDWLEDAYINDPGRPDRGSPKAEAILALASDATKFIDKKRKK